MEGLSAWFNLTTNGRLAKYWIAEEMARTIWNDDYSDKTIMIQILKKEWFRFI